MINKLISAAHFQSAASLIHSEIDVKRFVEIEKKKFEEMNQRKVKPATTGNFFLFLSLKNIYIFFLILL